MPYVKQHYREALDPVVDATVQVLRNLELDFPEGNFEGNVNYLISKILSKVYTSGGYRGINDAVGVLECIKLEFYRRAAAGYEDKKIIENGDVYE